MIPLLARWSLRSLPEVRAERAARRRIHADIPVHDGGLRSPHRAAMRGTQSVVSKGVDGFEIDGQHVDNFSGSTLDVLAIAIRFALAKTFIPHLSMVMLDEPAHGCNRDRTSDVLGFLAGSGFEQVVLASHDELSESIADNVIALA